MFSVLQSQPRQCSLWCRNSSIDSSYPTHKPRWPHQSTSNQDRHTHKNKKICIITLCNLVSKQFPQIPSPQSQRWSALSKHWQKLCSFFELGIMEFTIVIISMTVLNVKKTLNKRHAINSDVACMFSAFSSQGTMSQGTHSPHVIFWPLTDHVPRPKQLPISTSRTIPASPTQLTRRLTHVLPPQSGVMVRFGV